MRRFSVIVASAFFLLVPWHSSAQDSSRVESCLAGVKTYTFHLADEGINAGRLNGILIQQHLQLDPVIDTHWNANQIVPAEADVVTIEFERASCSDNKNRKKPGPDMSTLAIGGCSQEGCIGNLPFEFSTGQPGDTVTINMCHASTGRQESGSFKMNAQGQWVMTKFTSEHVTSCEPS